LPFDIKELKATIDSHGYLKQHSYEFYFNPPPILQNERINTGTEGPSQSVIDITKLMLFRAEQASIPGSLLLTADNSRYGIGPTQKNPFNVLFSDTNVVFLADRFGLIQTFFYVWHNKIFNFDKNLAQGSVPSYTVEYKKNYVTDLSLIVYDPTGQAAMGFKFIDAWPTVVPGSPLAWGATDQLLKINVGFTFQRYEITDVSSINNFNPNSPTTVDSWTSNGPGLTISNPLTSVITGAIR
jgi:hypothetical protein